MAEISPTTPSVPPAVTPLRRLPGSSPSLRGRYVARSRLWLDGTQLIQESVRYYTQELQRFALADIQSVQVRRTPRGLIYNVVLGVLMALPLLGMVATWNEGPSPGGARYVWEAVAAFFGVFLFVNVLRGPTCRTVLTTAVGPQHLPSLCRVGTARRALALITANVAAVQGALQPDEAAREVDRARAATPSAPAASGGAPSQSYNY